MRDSEGRGSLRISDMWWAPCCSKLATTAAMHLTKRRHAACLAIRSQLAVWTRHPAAGVASSFQSRQFHAAGPFRLPLDLGSDSPRPTEWLSPRPAEADEQLEADGRAVRPAHCLKIYNSVLKRQGADGSALSGGIRQG